MMVSARSLKRCRVRSTQKSGEENWVPTDVDLECSRRPTANRLDHVGWDTSLSERSSTSSTQRLTSDVVTEMSMEEVEKPGASQDYSITLQP